MELVPWNRFLGSITWRTKTIFFGSKRRKTNIFLPQLVKEQRKTNFSFLNYQRNEDKPKYLFLNHWRNEEKVLHSALKNQRGKQKRIYLFLNYRRNEDKPKYLFLNYRRNEDKAKYSFLNYRRNEDEAKYLFLNYRCFYIARWWGVVWGVRCEKRGQESSSQIISPWLGDIVDSGIWLSTLSLQSGTKNSATGCHRHPSDRLHTSR